MECSTAQVDRIPYITPFGQVNKVKNLLSLVNVLTDSLGEASYTVVSVKRIQIPQVYK